MMPDCLAQRHDAAMADIRALLERFVEALDAREQRMDGRATAGHVARIESVRDRLGALLADVDEA